MSYFIVPAITDQAGQCRIVHRSGFAGDPSKNYKQEPDQWKEVGHMNSQGKLIALDAPKEVWDGIKMCEPLMGGLQFRESDFYAVQLRILGDANALKELFYKRENDRFSMVHITLDGESKLGWYERTEHDPFTAKATVAEILEDGSRNEAMTLSVNARGELSLVAGGQKLPCAVLTTGVPDGMEPDNAEANVGFAKAMMRRLWWTASSEDELQQDVDNLVLNGAHICSIAWEEDRAVCNYTFALDYTKAQAILNGHDPNPEEWLEEKNGNSAIDMIAADLKSPSYVNNTQQEAVRLHNKP